MKNMLIALCLLNGLSISAQEFHKGSKFALGTAVFETLNFTDLTASPQKAGISPNSLYYQGSGVAIFEMNDWFGLRADIQVSYTDGSAKGSRYVQNLFGQTKANYTEKYTNFSASVPLLLRFRHQLDLMGLYAEAGYMLQYNILNWVSRTYENSSIQDVHGFEDRAFDQSNATTHFFNFGLGLDFNHHLSQRRYFIELRYFPELSSLGSVDGNSVKMRGFTLGAGFVL